MEPVLLGKREGDEPEDRDCHEPLERGSKMRGEGSNQDKDRRHRGESTVATGHLLQYCVAFPDSEAVAFAVLATMKVRALEIETCGADPPAPLGQTWI